MDTFVPRVPQQRLADIGVALLGAGRQEMVALQATGTGKTIGGLHLGHEASRRGLIDSSIIFSPRRNLADQWAAAWLNLRARYDRPRLGAIASRENEALLLRSRAASGYASTYASLVAAREGGGNVHLRAMNGRRVMLFLDEAQILGMDDQGGGTQAAELVAELSARAAFTVLLTGTPYRADNLPLLTARYGAPDARGCRHLLADMEYSYREGMRDGYLRPLKAVLVDGFAVQAREGGRERRLVLSKSGGALKGALLHEGYWRPLVDRVVAQVRRVQAIDRRLCGLIAACNQRHAQEIQRYVAAAHPALRTLIAVSDDRAAVANLAAFRRGGHDLLITVAMAYVGYDHPPIAVVGILTDIRHPGYIHQLLGRGVRMMADIPAARQVLYAVVPDDPQMVPIVRELRAESQAGLARRGLPVAAGTGPARPRPVVAAGATGARAEGFLPGGDLSAEEYHALARAQEALGLGGVAPTALARLLRANDVRISELRVPAPAGAARAET